MLANDAGADKPEKATKDHQFFPTIQLDTTARSVSKALRRVGRFLIL